MSSRRRLAQDTAALYAAPPPDFFFPASTSDSLNTLTIHLLGPTSTPYESGVFTLTLRIPPAYPAEPPKANFQTKIFHPNVDERTGDVCVDTLKRDWKPELTLRDICVTIRCLLVYPNPASALNENAGRMCNEDWAEFDQHARLMAEVHARCPEELRELAEECRARDRGAEQEAAAAAAAAQKSIKEKKETPLKQQVKGKQILGKQPPSGMRKIKRAVSPGAKKASASPASASDPDAGKENVASVRAVSPTSSKRSREDSLGADDKLRSDTSDTSVDSGRKSPKLVEGDDAITRIKKKPVVKTKKVAKNTKKKSTVRIGLKRF